MEVVSIAALALGMIFVGSGHPELTQTLTMALMDRDESSLNVTYSKLLCLSLGLLYLCKLPSNIFSTPPTIFLPPKYIFLPPKFFYTPPKNFPY
jgi:hypothetical protein